MAARRKNQSAPALVSGIPTASGQRYAGSVARAIWCPRPA